MRLPVPVILGTDAPAVATVEQAIDPLGAALWYVQGSEDMALLTVRLEFNAAGQPLYSERQVICNGQEIGS